MSTCSMILAWKYNITAGMYMTFRKNSPDKGWVSYLMTTLNSKNMISTTKWYYFRNRICTIIILYYFFLKRLIIFVLFFWQFNKKSPFKYIDNSQANICSTYPDLLVVPSKMPFDEIIKCSRFRSRERLPVLTYAFKKRPNSPYTTLWRCA